MITMALSYLGSFTIILFSTVIASWAARILSTRLMAAFEDKWDEEDQLTLQLTPFQAEVPKEREEFWFPALSTIYRRAFLRNATRTRRTAASLVTSLRTEQTNSFDHDRPRFQMEWKR